SCVLFRPVHGKARWELEGPRGTEVIEVTGAISTDDMSCAHAAINEGAGIGLLPAFHGHNLVRVLPSHAFHGSASNVVYPSARYVPLRVALLRDAILEAAPRECTGDAVARKTKTG